MQKKNRKEEETEAVNDGTNNLSGKGKEKVRKGKFPVLEEQQGYFYSVTKIRWMLDRKT